MNLNEIQRASLTALLAVLNDNFPGDFATETLTAYISDHELTNNIDLAWFANTINRGLMAFLGKDGNNITDLNVVASKPTPPATEAQTHRPEIEKPNANRCRICNVAECIPSHIVPNNESADFWEFIGLFRVSTVISSLKAAARCHDATGPENPLNILGLCQNCRCLFTHSLVSFLPQIVEAKPVFAFPYDPRMVTSYKVVSEFPGGLKSAVIKIMDDENGDKCLLPGDVFALNTVDAIKCPLPHPALLQVNVLCSRMVNMRNAIGCPVVIPAEGEEGTAVTWCEVADGSDGGGHRNVAEGTNYREVQEQPGKRRSARKSVRKAKSMA
ncbi:hypothetical protein Q9L58_009724 [Maublancomyces gigas]|uniref:HNH nuclease domain-containing protein n=1 Tax=Discina gigas TaxID=1032678 RepID=A0ABR3G750_9PEZI